jgi:hypothetical protein
MPIPKVKQKEPQADYVSRCMSVISGEYDSNEQAIAICINTYEKETMSMSKQSRVGIRIEGTNIINQFRNNKIVNA